ncbi:GFA family protein [Xenorhabdus bovienii]|uniref:CENP-V/GFA domain-containing protein n=1 Tax=Xenorhabdus bovienii str. kraussei Quebec TaxID=1398203 RepID=A0A077PP25_XENBV|nr:GFA family protein [Xenorhabdus bovienii]MDE1475168.1 GFA family protein [Xenorhabdus bovienii]MDE9446319.1 GFA family protein [Xenorhabdus bovienii]MDE9459152.1 GFA family protein [Xenorhabdus bovienii]MDE9487469.1 GFA family protein [Xenorhabdus bovienii]MDE9515651.1 GFA family protein [Xenorhabdus bovienii]
MSQKEYKGGCLCGNIKFIATGIPNFPHTCSCTMCQKHSGALTLCWVEFPKDVVQWIGEGGLPSLYRSSDYSSRAFCSRCGSSLGAIDDGPTVGLILGNFDNNGQQELIPLSHSYQESHPQWWEIEIKQE